LFQDIHKILEDNLEIVDKLKELIIDWVQQGYQDFFRELEVQFISFLGRNNSSATPSHGLMEGAQGVKAFPSLVLVLAQLSAFIGQTAIPKITEARFHLIALYLIFNSLK